jgi:hypothetical protein
MLALKLFRRSTLASLRPALSSNKISFLDRRQFASQRKENSQKKLQELKENWMPIYAFPKIRGVAAITKLKNYQLAATLGGFPVVCYSFTEHLFLYSYLAGTIAFSLCVASNLLKNSIGFIYVNNTNKDLVRIAYLNFWGKRCDTEFKVDEIVPFDELPKRYTDRFYTTLEFKKKHEELKLLNKECDVLQYEEYQRIFGNF